MLLLGLACVVSVPAFAGPPPGFQPGVEGQEGFGPAAWSPDGRSVALTRWDRAGLLVYTPDDDTIVVASEARGAGFRPDWDGGSVLFKEVTPERHRAVAFDPTQNQRTILREATQLGEPIAEGGRRVLAEGRRLTVSEHAGFEGAEVDLGSTPHLTEPDPTGRRVAFVGDRLGVLDLDTGRTRWLTPVGAWSHPRWSPDGTRLLVRTPADGFLVLDPDTGAPLAGADGTDPAWMPDGSVVYEVVETEGYTVVSATLRRLDVSTGRRTTLLADLALHPRYPAPSPTGGLSFTDTRTGDLWWLPKEGAPRRLLSAEDAPEGMSDSGAPPPTGAPPPNDSAIAYVPYMHQLWDTPDSFDGGWSCGPTSCTQLLGRWSILPNADITCSWPTPHTSHWGNYIPYPYSFNGYTYDAWGVAAGGDCQGAHGYICRQYGGAVWAYMVQFMLQHGIDSAQVGSGHSTFIGEVEAGNPLYASVSVLGYGHIIVLRGYASGTAMVTNDPYGNAGTGDWGNNDGEGAVYDWPGTNTGHLEIGVSQLFTAHGPAVDGSGGETPPVDTGTPPPPPNESPVAVAGQDVTLGLGAPVILDGARSYDPDGSVVAYTWILPSGRGATEGPMVTWTPDAAGEYDAMLTVIDDRGGTATDSLHITVGPTAHAEVIREAEAGCGCGVGGVPAGGWVLIGLAGAALSRRGPKARR